MPPAREQSENVYVTTPHLEAAIKAGVAPLRRELDAVRREVSDVAEGVVTISEDLTDLAIRLDARRRRLRRWLAANADRAAVKAVELGAVAGTGALATYLLTHL